MIKDAGTGKLTIQQKIEYMEAMHLNDRERLVIHEGGVMIGREEGREEEKRRIALAMLADEMEIPLVAKYSGLSEEEVKNLAK